MVRLHEFYQKDVVEQLMKGGKYTNRMQIPKVEKVVILWPSGREQTLQAPALGQLHHLKEPV